MKKVLEIGCGQGFNSYYLSKSSDVIGVDFSEVDVLIAKKRYPKVDFRVMDAGELTFEDNYFDEVYAIDILEHADDLNSVLREVRRVLKLGGKFIVNIPAEKSEEWLLKVRPSYFKEIHHVRIFKKNELENILNKEGLKMLSKKPKGFLQHIELYFLFKRKKYSSGQLGIGNWRDSVFTKIVHVAILCLDPIMLKTPLKYFPICIITLPIGFFMSLIGNIIFPKSFYYEFEKTQK